MGLLDNKDDLTALLLAMGFGTLGARKSTPLQALGQGGLLGMNAMYENQQNRRRNELTDQENAYRKLQTEHLQQQMEQARAAQAKQAAMVDLARNSFTPGAPGTPEMGPPGPMGQMQAPVPATPEAFDQSKFLSGLRQLDPIAAMQMQKQDSPYDKPKPEHYTPASLGKFAQTRNPADLVPIDSATVGKVNPGDFTAASLQKYRQTGNYADLVPIDKRPVTSTTVHLPPIEGEEQKSIGKARGEAYYQIQTGATKAAAQLNNINAIDTLLKGVETNALTPVGMKVSGAARALGIDIDPNLAAKQAADAISSKLALDARSTAEGGGMPGAMSDADREFLRNMNPNVAQTPEGRAMLIEVQRRILKRQQEVAALARQYRAKNGTFDEGFANVAEANAAQKPLFADMPNMGGGISSGGKIRQGAPVGGSRSIDDLIKQYAR